MLRRAQAIPALFVVTACMLAFEVALTRVCSVLLQYHVSFAVVSLAVLGLGLGGFVAFLSVRDHPGRPGPPGAATGRACTLALLGVSPGMLLALVCLLRLPFAESWTWLVFLVLPAFACAGAFQSLVLRALARDASLLYATDLLGGAAGALVAVVAIDTVGGPVAAMLVLAVVAAGAALWWTADRVRRGESARRTALAGGTLAGVALVALLAQVKTGWLDVRYELAPHKLIHQLLRRTPAGAPHLLPELERWDAYSRVDVAEMRTPAGVQRLVFIDGETPTPMLAAQATTPGGASLEIRESLPALPYRLLAPRTVLSIGTGGGYDVVLAKRFAAARIDAVELNAGVLEVVERAREFTGDVYGQEGVSVHHAEGRRFARASRAGSYDLVGLVLAQSLAGNLREYALSENYLYTREAFADYLRVLRPGGAIALLVNDELLLRKLLRTALEVLEAHGHQAARCVAALASPQESPYDRLLLVRNEPFTPEQRQRIATEAEVRNYTLVHMPGDGWPGDGWKQPAGGAGAAGLAGARLSPATDDRPFVFHLQETLPPALGLLLGAATGLLVLACGALPFVARRFAAPRGAPVAGLYFALLGLGFMIVEVLVLQKSLLVIGHPTWNLAVILATFLLAAGLGSAASSKITMASERSPLGAHPALGTHPTHHAHPARRRLALALVGPALASLVLVRLLELLHARADGWPLAVRCLVVGTTLFPAGFLMGMPFPLAIRALPRTVVALVPWFWGLNGVASILGSALAVAVVLEAGFRLASLLPALCYAGAAACVFIAFSGEPQGERARGDVGDRRGS